MLIKKVPFTSILILIIFLTLVNPSQSACQACYQESANTNCRPDENNIQAYTLHMSVHPHLDAFWIFDFQSYYNPQPNQGDVRSYFASNRFHSVKQIFDTATEVLTKSKQTRQNQGPSTQKAHRSFFNSQMGFFKRWYSEQNQTKKQQVKALLKTKYWEIVNGGYVEHDEGCAYYDDIIENFETGLRFLKQQFQYYPRAAISADSFGHSTSTMSILAHMGVEGFFVQRSDEHILLQNKTEFIWKAKSANGRFYGALPTHIRWAIHGFQDQFIGGNPSQKVCQTKTPYINNLHRENQFLKRILKSNHIMRYFGHDFQQFDDYSYHVIQGMMQAFSMQKCNRVTAVYGNPTEYFLTLMGEVFNKVKPVAFRQEDIMPIWDYDSGLYWTGYYTTDPYHKKNYRDAGRFLYAIRKAFTPLYITQPNSQEHKKSYKLLQQFAETVAYLQHHDGITGTSKYTVMDKYQKLNNQQTEQLKKTVLREMFQVQFPINSNNIVFDCILTSECTLPSNITNGDIILKVFKSGGNNYNPIVLHLNQNQWYQPDCPYQLVCPCTALPCGCSLNLFPPLLGTYSLIKLAKVQSFTSSPIFLHNLSETDEIVSKNSSHLILTLNKKQYFLSYKKLNADPTPRVYDHLSRFGEQGRRSFSIRSGKYALGSYIKTQASLSKIRKILKFQGTKIVKYIVLWAREGMKTVITIVKGVQNQWKIQTFSAAESGKLEDLYLQISAPHIKNQKKFYTDSNGWLVLKRQLNKHEDYQAHFSKQGFDDIDGNSYPMTAFAYIEDSQQKVSINTDRPQGVTAYHPGSIWVNFDRLSSDDGKWVYENTYRSEYQKYVHYVTVQNVNNNERKIQKRYDEPLLIQGNLVQSSQRITNQDVYTKGREQWQSKTNINNVKFTVRPWNDSSLLLRVHNLKDQENAKVQLFSQDDRICTFLTAFYGNSIKYGSVQETNMGGNIKYEEFLNKKWNWQKVVNLSVQNQIFNKEFGQQILLRPLQIRTFLFKNISMNTQGCKGIDQIKLNGKTTKYQLDLNKPMPIRSAEDTLNENTVKNYLLYQNHCTNPSPIVTVNNNKILPNPVITPPIITPQPTPQKQIKPQPTKPSIITQPQSIKTKPVVSPPNQNTVRQVPTPISTQTLSPEEKFNKELNIIRERIVQRKTLTRQQKQKYFTQLLKEIKKQKNETVEQTNKINYESAHSLH